MARARENERCALRFPQTGKKISGGKNISDPTYFRERERERKGNIALQLAYSKLKGFVKKGQSRKKGNNNVTPFPVIKLALHLLWDRGREQIFVPSCCVWGEGEPFWRRRVYMIDICSFSPPSLSHSVPLSCPLSIHKMHGMTFAIK